MFEPRQAQFVHSVPKGCNAYVLATSIGTNALIIEKDIPSTLRLYHSIKAFLPKRQVFLFPDQETLAYDDFSPPPSLISQRLEVLALESTEKIIITSVSTLMQRLPPRRWLLARRLRFAKGDLLDHVTFTKLLEEAGYTRTPLVTEAGQFAVRGAIIDLYPMGSAVPYRLECFGDEIDTMRSFNPRTQRTTVRTDEINLLPTAEFSLDDETVQHFCPRYRATFPGSSAIYEAVSERRPFAGMEYFLPWLHVQPLQTLFDYFDSRATVYCCEGIFPHAKAFYHNCQQRYQDKTSRERPALPAHELFLSPAELKQILEKRHCVHLKSGHRYDGKRHIRCSLKPLQKRPPQVKNVIQYAHLKPRSVICALESQRYIESCSQQLGQLGIASQTVDNWQEASAMDVRKNGTVLIKLPLPTGFFDSEKGLLMLSQKELFGSEAVVQHNGEHVQERFGPADTLQQRQNLASLIPGQAVVHEEQGVGRYFGLQTLPVAGEQQDFVCLHYADDGKLYIPVEDIHLLSPYLGDSDKAPLDALGSTRWRREKEKAQKQIEDVAAQLLEVYAQRAKSTGTTIRPDSEYAAFASQFIFDETPDQLRATDEIIKDLSQPKPMDRLVCGDVGFGKTEVAMRAAFIVAMAQQQVAVLTPTTLLANQHFQTFVDRFSGWPIRIAIISRLQSPEEIKQALKHLSRGRIDIVIGTHRLLQKDVAFSRLGLLIVDEEHRFGVRQKDSFKRLRANVNVMRMSATPIPRSLNIAFSRLSDISVITTPPPNRVPTKTFVCEWDRGLIREALTRELHRDGQLFFIHNDIATIESIKRQLLDIIPDLIIGVIHGKMPRQQIENVMRAFYQRQQQVLLSTTIIETGIDVPNANTMIIHRADKLGLAQLHQLRGRVGRSNHQGYAYLLTPPADALPKDALRRLLAIEQADALGSGFQLALDDLEIRGAGELLGDQQKGHIQRIGLNAYLNMLDQAVAKITPTPKDQSPLRECEVCLGVSAAIPSEYIDYVPTRVEFYQRIRRARSQHQIDDIHRELADRFGILPDPVRNMLNIQALRSHAQQLHIKAIKRLAERLDVELYEDAPIDHDALIHQLHKSAHWRLKNPSTLSVHKRFDDVQQCIEYVYGLTKLIVNPRAGK